MQTRKSGKPNVRREERPLSESGSEREKRLADALREAHQLLEAYAPMWYTEALKKKIEAALEG